MTHISTTQSKQHTHRVYSEEAQENRKALEPDLLKLRDNPSIQGMLDKEDDDYSHTEIVTKNFLNAYYDKALHSNALLHASAHILTDQMEANKRQIKTALEAFQHMEPKKHQALMKKIIKEAKLRAGSNLLEKDVAEKITQDETLFAQAYKFLLLHNPDNFLQWMSNAYKDALPVEFFTSPYKFEEQMSKNSPQKARKAILKQTKSIQEEIEAKKVEHQQKAEIKRKAIEAQKAEEAKKAEAAQKAAEAKKLEQERKPVGYSYSTIVTVLRELHNKGNGDSQYWIRTVQDHEKALHAMSAYITALADAETGVPREELLIIADKLQTIDIGTSGDPSYWAKQSSKVIKQAHEISYELAKISKNSKIQLPKSVVLTSLSKILTDTRTEAYGSSNYYMRATTMAVRISQAVGKAVVELSKTLKAPHKVLVSDLGQQLLNTSSKGSGSIDYWIERFNTIHDQMHNIGNTIAHVANILKETP